MPAYARLAFKDPSTDKWVANLATGGTKVRYQAADGSVQWARMTIRNTMVRNPEYNGGANGQPEWTSLTG